MPGICDYVTLSGKRLKILKEEVYPIMVGLIEIHELLKVQKAEGWEIRQQEQEEARFTL